MTCHLDDSQIRALAPSVFAVNPTPGVSDHSFFLPTSSVLDGMRDNGWLPVRAQEQYVRTADNRGFRKHIIRL